MVEPVSWTTEARVAGDGYRWRYRRYAPAGPARARVVFLHGIQSHAGWYVDSCQFLQRCGFEVLFVDRRGSGENGENRGDAPFFRRLLDDVAELLQSLQADRARSPLFLAGISWGGKVATALLKRHPGLVDGLLLIAPGFFAQIRPSWRERLRIAWARITDPGRLFPVPLNDPELFTATPRRLDFLRGDPLALREATSRLLIESVRLDGYLKVVPRYVTVPVLLVLAGKDRIIDNDRTRRYVGRFASVDQTIVEYPEAHHTLEFEPDPSSYFDDLKRWLEARVPKV